MTVEASLPARSRIRRGLRWTERAGLIVVMGACAVLGVLSIAAGTVEAIRGVNGMVTLDLPLDESPQRLVSDGPARIVDGRFDGVFALSVENVDSGALVLHTAAMVAGFALVAAILAFVFSLCLRLYRGQPFGRLMTRGFGILSAVTIAMTLLLPAVLSVANTQIVASTGLAVEDTPFNTGYLFGTTDMVALACGVFMALMAGTFHIGTRLDQDTEGLI